MLLTKLGNFWAVAHIFNQTIAKTEVMDERQTETCLKEGGVLFPWVRWEDAYVSDFQIAKKGTLQTCMIREALTSLPRGQVLSIDEFRDWMAQKYHVLYSSESIRRTCLQNPYPLIFPSHRVMCSKKHHANLITERILAYEKDWVTSPLSGSASGVAQA